MFDTTKGIDAGVIRFDYDTVSADPDGTVKAGAALAGGFFINPGVGIKPGHTLHWVQTVTASTTGANGWNLPATNAGEFPDATPLSRVYPHETLPPLANPPNPAPFLAFQDVPCRSYSAGNTETWTAELGLVCIADSAGTDGFRECKVIATFLWGFDITNPMMPFDVDDVGNFNRSFWSAPTQSYLDTLNDFYDGMGGGGGDDGMGGTLPAVASTKFRFSADDNCFTEPPPPVCVPALPVWGMGLLTMAMAGIGLGLVRRTLASV